MENKPIIIMFCIVNITTLGKFLFSFHSTKLFFYIFDYISTAAQKMLNVFGSRSVVPHPPQSKLNKIFLTVV